ncbi:uncharacterized protein [Asterias amurensis]|uniref:uncharacterized protein n=1 Tax=Asterias amurensis TaxID=7602 RepID=UPI003AB4ECB9
MASTRKKMMQKSKQFLEEKIQRIEADQQWLAQAIMDISQPAITEAKKLLDESDQKRFFKKYQEVTSTLETSSSTLVLLVASFPSKENDSDGSESNCSADSNSELNDASIFSNASSVTASPLGSIKSRDGTLQVKESGLAGAKKKGLRESHPETKGDVGQSKPSLCGAMTTKEGCRTVSPLHEYESGTGSSRLADVVSSNDSASSVVNVNRETKPTGINHAHLEGGVLEGNFAVPKGSPAEHSTMPESAPLKSAQHQVSATASELSPHPTSKVLPPPTSKVSPPLGKATSAPAEDPTTQPQQSQPPFQNPLAPMQPCPSLHEIATGKQTAVIKPMEVKSRGHVEVIVSEVKRPALLWIQLADSPLSSFVADLNNFYSDAQIVSIPVPAPEVGTFCCARYSQNNCWYRARIAGVTKETPSGTQNTHDPSRILVDVIYIDYGNREKLNLTRVRVIHPKFTELPAQAFCCSLGKVKPPVTSGCWTKEQTYFFASLVIGKILKASIHVVAGRRMPLIDMSAPFMITRDGGEGQCVQVDVAQCMVEREMAQYLEGCGPPIQPHPSQQPTPDISSSGGSRDRQSKENVEPSLKSAAGDDRTQNLTRSKSSSSKEDTREASVTSQPSSDHETRRPSGGNEDQVPNFDRQQQENPREVNKRNLPKRNTQAEIAPRFTKKKMEYLDTVSGHHADSRRAQDNRHSGTSQPINARHQSQSDDPRQTDEDSVYEHADGDQYFKEADAAPGRTVQKEHTSTSNLSSSDGPNKSQSTNSKGHLKWSGRGSRINYPTNTPSQQLSRGRKKNDRGQQDDLSASPSRETMREASIPSMEFRKSSTVSFRNKLGRGNGSKSTSGRGTGKMLDTRDTPSPQAHPAEEEFERMSPNSSSGVSSFNSGQSNVQATATPQACSVNEEVPSIRSQEPRRRASGGSNYQDENSKQVAVSKQPEQSTTYTTSQDRRQGKVTGSKKAEAEDLKSLSSDSKNLSSSSGSFFSAVGGLDTFENTSKTSPSGPPAQKGKPKDSKHLQLCVRSSLQTKDGCVRMAMSHIVSPQEFYAHLITKDVEKLDYLDKDLNDFYNSEKNVASLTENLVLKEGCLCAAKYTVDGTWYRARILDIQDDIEDAKSSDEGGAPSTSEKAIPHKKVQLFYVDYGNREWLAADAIKPLQSSFYDLPAQVIKCCLAHIYPPDSPGEWEGSGTSIVSSKDHLRGGWSEEAVVEFAKMTGYEKLLLGRLLKEWDEQSDEPLQVLLLDPSSPWEICINQQLVNSGLAASSRLKAVAVQQDSLEPAEVTSQQLLKASEGWNIKRGHEGYEPVEEGALAEVKGQIVPREKWDPMLSDYTSDRNSYNIDVDDPGVATVGYKAQSTKSICKFFSSGRVCYRGNQCPHEHVRQGEIPGESVGVFYSNNPIRPPQAGNWVALQVTALQSAFHFWAQLPYSARPLDSLKQTGAPSDDEYEVETLEMLEVALNQAYNSSKRHQNQHANQILRAQGEMVCCQSPQDQRFYRARVREVDTQQDSMQVFYVDYGDTEWVPSSNIRDMQPQFLHLPLQAVECYLVGARPVEFNVDEAGTGHNEEARKMFEEMVSKKTLVAHIANAYPILEVELYDTNGKSDINIGMALIENGLATREDWEDIQDDTQETSSSEGGRGSRSNRGGSNQAAGGSRSETSSGVVEVKYTPV